MGKKASGKGGRNKVETKVKKKKNQFKALQKNQEIRHVINNVKQPHTVPKKQQRCTKTVSDEFRNFDERMAAMKRKHASKGSTLKNVVVAPPTFVMSGPTFKLGNVALESETQREVEGFHGFLSAMQAPSTTPQLPIREKKKAVPIFEKKQPNNVFALLGENDDQIPQSISVLPPSIRPATFSLQNSGTIPMTSFKGDGLTSLQRSLQSIKTTPISIDLNDL